MSQNIELDALILRNLGDLDGAARRIEALSDVIWRGLGEPVQAWAARHGWVTQMEVDGWAAPETWRDPEADDDDGFAAHFAFAYAGGDSGDHRSGEDYFELTRLFAAGHGRYGLRFEQGLRKPAKWKAFRSNRPDLVQAVAEVLPIDAKGAFFLSFKLNVEAVVLAMQEDDYSEAARPIIEALERLERGRPTFDRMIAGMRENE